MKILLPHWNLKSFDRAIPQMKSISERVDEFHIVYVDAEPQPEWDRYFSFHKLHIPYSFVRSKIARFFLSRGKLHNQIKDTDVDVFYTISGLWGQELSRYCSNKMKVPYVIKLRGDHKKVRKVMKTNLIKEKVCNYLETRSLKQANLVIPISRGLAKKAEEWGVQKERIAPPVWNGVDTNVFKPMKVKRTSDFTVAYAGRLSPEKGILRLMRLAEKLVHVHFVVAGRKDMSLSFPSNAEYLGRLSFSEMPIFYNKADLFVLPSLTEGFPNVVLEAYSCGKPVLAVREAFPEELKVFGSVADIDEFELEIDRLRRSDLKALGLQARSYIEKRYTWDKFGESIVNCLNRVVN